MNKTIIALVLALSACSSNIPKATVMITNLDENSGGSGTILRSYSEYSEILTNAHVCNVVKHGGVVHTYMGKFLVAAFKKSTLHDLCLILVPANLHVNTIVAATEAPFLDEATVSGHPILLPLIISKGHFSQHKMVQIMTGMRPCTEADKAAPGLGLLCALLGGIPKVTTYDSIVVSALIQPGSSGSAVYDYNGHISAVIFAGSGSLSYGLAVPHAYVKAFTTSESPNLQYIAVSTETDAGDMAYNPTTIEDKLAEVCDGATDPAIKQICNFYSDMVVR
jgi:hypothetical protein